jgi:glucose-6-phosphate isomerase
MAIGEAAFMRLLAGGAAMDAHVRQASVAHNLPLHLALLGIWNRNFLKMPTHHLAPYPSAMADFVRFIQQMDMESNGKRIHVDGSEVAIDTGPVVWGGPGIDGQHAYFQLLHQGTQRMPIDFIGVQQDATPLPLASEHHRITLLYLRAQAQALATGRTPEATKAMLQAQGLDAEHLTPHRSFPGNVPSNILWLPKLDPDHLGALIAAYEHKVFYQAAIWGIHAYDQWGVELGKTLAQSMDKGA